MYVHLNCGHPHVVLIFPLPAVLVLATGSKWTGPIAYPDDDADIPQFVTGWQQRFKSAADVVIVGGGSVGIGMWGIYCRFSFCLTLPNSVELAGELRDEYPVSAYPRSCSESDADLQMQEKKITIIQGDTMLLNSAYPNKFRKYMESQLRARNIDLLLGDYVDKVPENGSGKLEFRSGRSIQASLVVSISFAYVRSQRPSTLIFQLGHNFWT